MIAIQVALGIIIAFIVIKNWDKSKKYALNALIITACIAVLALIIIFFIWLKDYLIENIDRKLLTSIASFVGIIIGLLGYQSLNNYLTKRFSNLSDKNKKILQTIWHYLYISLWVFLIATFMYLVLITGVQILFPAFEEKYRNYLSYSLVIFSLVLSCFIANKRYKHRLNAAKQK